MGFLTDGTTFQWEEIVERPVDYVKKHGVLQFLAIYDRIKDRTRDSLRWGDEIEYILVKMDKEKKQVKLLLKGPQYLEVLSIPEHQDAEHAESLWRPEYAAYMLEGTPGKPFGSNGIMDLLVIEESMEKRRKEAQKLLEADEFIVTVANFPLLGARQFEKEGYEYVLPFHKVEGPVACSLFTSDDIIHPHVRFSTLTANIRRRRGSKVEIIVPLFKDKNTSKEPLPLPPITNVSNFNSYGTIPKDALLPHNIYCDSMAFGMGCCCLQTTLQCCNIQEARYFYDQLAVLSPILMAMTAATPIVRGYLADTDCRWNIISASVDDRTPYERGLRDTLHTNDTNKFVINKSRYDSIDCYISTDKRLRPEYNDIPLVYDKEFCQQLQNNGVDELLARHIAHLFIRDPLVIYKDKILLDDKSRSDHFENIQSTNWQTVRFKPPPPNSDIGWRVEFRPMEIQLSDFENAAFVVFIVLITRVLSAFDLNMYIPLSKVDQNLQTAQMRDAVLNHSFYFRKNLSAANSNQNVNDEYDLMTINEIMNGNPSKSIVGLIPLVHIYLDTLSIASEVRSKISRYLNFLSKRASGELVTGAKFMRSFVLSHPDYKQDSVVSPAIAYDLMETCIKIGQKEESPKELLGEFS